MTKDDHKLAVREILNRYGLENKIGVGGVVNEISELCETRVKGVEKALRIKWLVEEYNYNPNLEV